MPQYRVYSVSPRGAIVGDRTFDAITDEHAVFAVRAMQRPDDCEIWKGDMRIAKVPAHIKA